MKATASELLRQPPGKVTDEWPMGERFIRGLAHGSMSVEIRFSRDRNLLGPVSPQATAPDHTRQSVAVAIERLAQAIDDADASAANKRAATLLLRAFQEHPLLRIIAPGGAEGLSDSRPKPDSAP